jgi:transposase-like protein
MADREPRLACPHCDNDDRTMLTRVPAQTPTYYCENCSKEFVVRAQTDRRKV